MTPLSYHLRSLRARAGTTLAAVVGMALVVFVFAATLMLLAGLEQALAGEGQADRAIVIRDGSEAELSSQFETGLAARTLQMPEVLLAEGEVVVTVTLARRDGGGVANAVLRGVGPRSAELRPELVIVAGRAPASGAAEVMVGQALGGRLAGTRLGETIDLGSQGDATVVGVFAAHGSTLESEVWADIDLVRAATGRRGLVSTVRVRLRSPADLAAFDARVREDAEAGLMAVGEVAYLQAQGNRISRFVIGIGTLLAACFVLGSIIGVTVTLHASVAARRRELGTLRALGFSRGAILGGVLFESALVGAAGAALGLCGAVALAHERFALLNVASWSELVFELRLTPGVVAAAVGLAVTAGLLGGLAPALRAAFTPPALAVKR